MAMNIVSLMLVTSTLITAISAHSSQTSGQDERARKLFDELDKRMTGSEAEAILEQVDVGERDAIKIGSCSVSYILSYNDYSCTLKQLSDPYFLKDNCSNTIPNQGVRQFIEERIARRLHQCSQNYYSILQEAIADIKPEDKKIVEGLLDINLKKWSFGLLGRPNDESKRDQRIKTCVNFIHKLSFMSTIRPISMPSSIDDRAERELQSFSDWHILLEKCRRHMEKQCKPYYISWPSPPYWFPLRANDEHRNDENIELENQCHEIVDIVASKKTKNKAVAELREAGNAWRKKEAEKNKKQEEIMIDALQFQRADEKKWLRAFHNEMHSDPY